MESLIHDFKKYESIMENYIKTGVLSFNDYNFISEHTLIPLLTHFNIKSIKNAEAKPEIKNYLSIFFSSEKNNFNTIFREINPKTINNNNIQENILNLLKFKPDLNSYYYILGELFSNIEDHSNSTKAYIAVKEYPDGIMDLCILDNGKSIPFSYEFNPKLKDNEYIEKALSGISTKKEGLRGYGLRTTMNYITSVPKGEMLIASHNGIYYKKNRFIQSLISDYGHIDGTLISIRFDTDNLHHLMDYLE